jgi:Putative MetA-pathway of phenol degradation
MTDTNRHILSATNVRYLLLTLLCGASTHAYANTAIETETAQIGKQGEANFSQAFEFEHGEDGNARGTLTQYEYGISDRSEILIEPFFYVGLSPKGGKSVSGLGDLEITPSYMMVLEDSWVPAVLAAFKVKVPTGSKKVEGTGKFDLFPYLIFGQHYGGWVFNANLGVNFAKPEGGGGYEKKTVWDLEAERKVMPDLTLYFEVFSAEDGVKTVSISAEHQFTRRFNVFAVVSRTEEHANVFRVGFNIGMGKGFE